MIKEYQNGDVIFREGEDGNSFFQIRSGVVGIYSDYEGIDELKLTELKQWGIFGEMAVIDSCPRSATAVVLRDDTKIREIPSEEIREYLGENPDHILMLMRHMSTRLTELTADYNDVCSVIREIEKNDRLAGREDLIARMRKFAGVHKRNKKPVDFMSAEYFNNVKEELHSKGFFKKVETYPAGTVICKEGETIRCMYDLHWGKVGIYTGYGTPEEQKLTELYTNSFFGEAGLVTNQPRSATVVALEDSTVEIIYAEDLNELFEKNPPKIDMILRHMSRRLRALTNQYLKACTLAWEMAQDEEQYGKLSPELAEKVKSYKARFYE